MSAGLDGLAELTDMRVAKAPTLEEKALIRAAEMARLRSFAVEAE